MKPRLNVKELWPTLKESFTDWKEDDALSLGAALAYYTVFSLAPLLVVVIAVAGLAFGREAVEGQLVHQIDGLIGRQGAEAVQTMIAHTARTGSGGLAAVIGLVTILFGASGVFTQLQKSLNKIWEVEPRPDQGISGLVRARALSFGMVLAIGFLLLVSLIAAAALAALDTYLTGLLPGLETLLQVLSFLLSLALVTLLFAMIFRYLPDVRIAWRDVWLGALVTSLLFAVGKVLIGLYLGHSSTASSYGAAGSLVVLLLWIYYSAQILFFGAEITQVHARRAGRPIAPDEHAVQVAEVKVEGSKKKGEGAAAPPPSRDRRSV